MDYEATDRFMSSWVVACERSGVLFFLTDEGLATDMLARAHLWRWQDHAEDAAKRATAEPGWKGFVWRAMSVPEAMNSRRRSA